MSRSVRERISCVHSFPRVSGDEPNLVETQEVRGPFSPRERG